MFKRLQTSLTDQPQAKSGGEGERAIDVSNHLARPAHMYHITASDGLQFNNHWFAVTIVTVILCKAPEADIAEAF